jgi:hypothetical protein
MRRIGSAQEPKIARQEVAMSLLGRLAQARAELAEFGEDPLRKKVEDVVRGKDAISTAALLQELSLRANTGNARRVAKLVRSLGYVAIKSRTLQPGGFRDTIARGWSRTTKSSPTTKTAGAAGINRHSSVEPPLATF